MRTRRQALPGFLFTFAHAVAFKGGSSTPAVQQAAPPPPPPPPEPEPIPTPEIAPPPPTIPIDTGAGTKLPPPEPPATPATPAPPASDKSSEIRDAQRDIRRKAGKRRGYLSTLLAGETGGAQGRQRTLLGQVNPMQ